MSEGGDSVDSAGAPGDRIVLARRTPWAKVGFQWTGAEPEGMNDPYLATDFGATWEGDELVTYNLAALLHDYGHRVDGYMEDSD
ncbi:MAG: hypothetical protein ACRDIU_05355 [Actinomycetota bacterium]